MEQSLTIADYLGAFRRRAWILILTMLIGTTVGGAVAYLLPPVYRSTAKILVESQQIPPELARSTVTASAAERLDLIQQRLMRRENLLDVIDRLKLYADRPDMPPGAKVEKVRGSTLIEIESSSFDNSRRRRGPVTISTFSITFEANNALQAALVADEFVTMIIHWNEQSRSTRASETNVFFMQELDRLEGELLAIEGQISAYKRENSTALPDSLEFRRSELADLEVRMFEREQRRLGLEESKRALEQSLLASDGVTAENELSDDEKELRELERTLAQQSAVYAESHPVIRKLSARIKVLREAIESTNASGTGASLRETELTQKIKLIDAQIALHIEQRAADEESKAALEASIAKTPEVEMALNALERRRSDLKIQYERAVLRQAEAETGEKLETNRQAERFEIIEQAGIPESPAAPNRVLIAGGGVFASAVLGIALMVLAEMLSRPIRTPRDLERLLELRPVVTIPYIRTAAEIHRQRIALSGVLLTLLVFVPSGLFVVDKYYLPLPVLVEQLMDRTGFGEFLRLIDQRF